MESKKTILIVTKEQVEQKLFLTALSGDYAVEVSNDGENALKFLQQNVSVALVITSLKIDRIDGIELIRLMKMTETLKLIPAMVILQEDNMIQMNEVIQNGAEDILTTSLSQELIRHRVDYIMKMTHLPTYRNVMEEMVIEQIDKYIDKLGICKCQTCRNDLATLALNHLKPKYVNSEKGRLISVTDKMSYDNILEIVGVIAECAESVKMNPRHTLVYGK